jgi:anti-sigma regulatory factor (Ser/Thr protein kinase)
MTIPATAVDAAAPGLPTEFTETLPREEASARRARALVDRALSAWNLEQLVENGTLIVSELATNSIQHSACRMLQVSVTLLADSRVRIAVSDTSPGLPAQRTAAADDENGRGMAVIAALADTIGTDASACGKRVWAELIAEGAAQ